jgi:hypothetical protein
VSATSSTSCASKTPSWQDAHSDPGPGPTERRPFARRSMMIAFSGAGGSCIYFLIFHRLVNDARLDGVAVLILAWLGASYAAYWWIVTERLRAQTLSAFLLFGAASVYAGAVLSVIGVTVLPWLAYEWPLAIGGGMLTGLAHFLAKRRAG